RPRKEGAAAGRPAGAGRRPRVRPSDPQGAGAGWLGGGDRPRDRPSDPHARYERDGMKLEAEIDGRLYKVTVADGPAGIMVALDGRSMSVDARALEGFFTSILIGGKAYE